MNANALKIEGPEPREAVRITDTPNATRTGSTGVTQSVAPSRRRHAGKALGVLLILAAVAYGGYRWWDYSRTWVTTDNAYVAGHIHTVSTRLAGTVTEVLVEDNAWVEAGAVLARLDAGDLNVQHDKAQAALAQAEAQLTQSRAQVTREEALVRKAQLDFDRSERLYTPGNAAVSKQEFDATQGALEAAQASLGATKAAVGAAEAQVQAARAALAEVALQLGYTRILAPATGRLGRKNIEVGNRVQPGQALLAIVQPDVWVTANFKETQLDRLHAGQAVTLRVDSFPGRVFAGHVESLAPASGAQFALLPPDNATGNFTKIVQRVPVKIVFDEDSVREFSGRLSPGMSAVVKIKVRS